MNKDNNIEEILKNIGAEELPPDVHQIAEQTSRDFEKNLTQSNQPKHFVLGDYIMKTRFIKIAAAALIFIAVLVGIPVIVDEPGVALADVLEKVQQAQAFTYKMKTTKMGNMMPGTPTSNTETDYTFFTFTMSDQYGVKMEQETVIENLQIRTHTLTYMLLNQKKIISLLFHKKEYMEMNLDEDYAASIRQQSNDPRDMIKKILATDYTELGRKTIEGVKVQGFQTTDPAFTAGFMESVNLTMWVDTEKWLPVLTEMHLKMNEQIQAQCVIYDYKWDIEVDAADFEPVIPKDFKAVTTDFQMPEMNLNINEEGAIEGLRFFAENSGKYPKKLNIIDLPQELYAIIETKDDMADKGQELSEEYLQKMEPASSLIVFYGTLKQEKKEPVYYGESVGPEDTEAVLMRWKTSEGQYRVIFGDLSAMDVTAEELAELEKPPSE